MTYARSRQSEDLATLPPLPGWVQRRARDAEEAAFLSGAALAALQGALAAGQVPQALLRQRLGLKAAEACVVLAGRPERAADLRDEVALMRPGDLPGPGGAVALQWRAAVARPLDAGIAGSVVPADMLARWPEWRRGPADPVARTAQVLGAALDAFPREEAGALILAEATLASELGWQHPLPLLATSLSGRDLRTRDAALRLACHRAIPLAAAAALALAGDLARRAARLQQVAPKLRAKGSDAAVALLMVSDALPPSAFLAPGIGLSDRAARRLCDRLVTLGAVRELTGRGSFRLYGI